MVKAKHWVVAVVAVMLTGLAAGPVAAQVGPSLVIEPWQSTDPHWAETVDEPVIINGGHAEGTNHDFDIFYWDSIGRVKPSRDDTDPNFWFGYRLLIIDIDTDVPNFPTSLTDVAVVGAFKLGEWEDWNVTLIAGAGAATNNHFSDGDAYYGIGNVNFEKILDENGSIHFGVNFNGNRTFLPDVPLPYAMYRRNVNDEFAFTLGVPASGFVWRPLEPLVIRAEYTVPTNVSGSAEWWFNKNFSIFGEYKRTLDAFHHDDFDENRRLFYELSRVAGGVRLIWEPYIDAKVGAGYAFDQKFSTGWDVRDLDTAVEPTDEVLFFFTIQGTF